MNELIKSEVLLEFTMLQMDELSSMYICEDGEDSGKEATPAQKSSFKLRMKAMLEAFKNFITNLITKIKTKILTKDMDKQIESAEKYAKILDSLEDKPQCELPDHKEEYKDIEYTRVQLGRIERKLKDGRPVTEDEVRGIMEEYRRRRIEHCTGGKRTGNYGWGVFGASANIKGITNAIRNTSTAIGIEAVKNNGNLAISAANLLIAGETLRAGVLLSKEEAELRTKDLSASVKFIKDLNSRGQKVHPELLQDIVKTQRGPIDRFFTG